MESALNSTTVQQEQSPQLNSSIRRCYKPRLRSRLRSNLNHKFISLNNRFISRYLFKEYHLQPKSRHKSQPSLKVNCPSDSLIPEIFDIRQVRVVLHKLQLFPLPPASPTPTPTTRDASTQTIDQFAQLSKESSTQTTDLLDPPSPVLSSVPSPRFSNSSFSEDELEAIKRFIVETDPDRHNHSTSSHNTTSDSSSNYSIGHLSLSPVPSSSSLSHSHNSSTGSRRTICISSSSSSSDIVSWIPVTRKPRAEDRSLESNAHLRSLIDWLRSSSP